MRDKLYKVTFELRQAKEARKKPTSPSLGELERETGQEGKAEGKHTTLRGEGPRRAPPPK